MSQDDNVKLVAYVRERDRILSLCEILVEKERMIKEEISAQLYEQVELQCWELLKSQTFPSPGFLLTDSDDVSNFDTIS